MNEATTDENDEEHMTDSPDEPTKTVSIAGWAEAAPSKKIEISADKDLEDISHEEKMEALRDDLRERGFSDDQIGEMALSVDGIVRISRGQQTCRPLEHNHE